MVKNFTCCKKRNVPQIGDHETPTGKLLCQKKRKTVLKHTCFIKIFFDRKTLAGDEYPASL